MAPDRASAPEAKPLRLFAAVDVPDAAKADVARSIAPFRPVVPARWTNSDGWHVTVKFLGTTWPRLVPFVHEAMAAAAAEVPAFQTALTELGVFPSVRRARVLWVGLRDEGGAFAAMAAALDRRLEEHFEPEARAFTPHLTLARMNPSRDLSEFAPGWVGTPVRSAPFDVARLVLYRSHLSPKGASYEPIAEFPLGRGA